MEPTALRESIPALEHVTYCNYGASGPSPRPVLEAATAALEDHEIAAHADGTPYDSAYEVYDRTREHVADLLGTSPETIALTQSTTDGINRIACALDWQPGDVVVRTDLEHPAGILPWKRLEGARDITVRVVDSERGRIDRAAFERAVSGAKLVCLSALSWNYGTRLPVRDLVEIAHDAGALVLVDAVQWPGQAPLDVTDWEADAVAAAGHKWLLGPWGAGFLHVAPAVAERLEPRTIGYRGVVEPAAREYTLEPGAARFEVGTTSPVPYAALQRAIEVVQSVGLERIEARIERLAGQLVEAVPAEQLCSPATPESGLVTIDVTDPEHCVQQLADSGIVVRSLSDPEAIRISLHAVTTEEDVAELVAALESYNIINT